MQRGSNIFFYRPAAAAVLVVAAAITVHYTTFALVAPVAVVPFVVFAVVVAADHQKKIDLLQVFVPQLSFPPSGRRNLRIPRLRPRLRRLPVPVLRRQRLPSGPESRCIQILRGEEVLPGWSQPGAGGGGWRVQEPEGRVEVRAGVIAARAGGNQV